MRFTFRGCRLPGNPGDGERPPVYPQRIQPANNWRRRRSFGLADRSLASHSIGRLNSFQQQFEGRFDKALLIGRQGIEHGLDLWA